MRSGGLGQTASHRPVKAAARGAEVRFAPVLHPATLSGVLAVERKPWEVMSSAP
jgi:hypothetical protein